MHNKLDSTGKIIQIGDTVVFTWSTDTKVYKGIVSEFTKVMVRIKYYWRPNNYINQDSKSVSETLKYPELLMVIEKI